MSQTFVLGSINKDFTYKVDRLPLPGETLNATSLKTSIGGKGANQAVAVARNDIETTLIACIGYKDQDIINELEANGIHTDFIRKTPEYPTGAATILLTDTDNSIIINHGANHSIDFTDVSKALETAEAGDYFISQLEVDVALVISSLKLAKEKGLITCLNPSPASNVPTEIYAYVDYLILNEVEVEQLTLTKPDIDINIYNIYQFFTGYGVKHVIITLGSEGACYLDGEDIYTMPAKPIQQGRLTSTVGAGDAFLGAFIAALINDVPIQESIVYANYAASIACQLEGGIDSMPRKIFTMNLIEEDRINEEDEDIEDNEKEIEH